jgi:hypothetical protein
LCDNGFGLILEKPFSMRASPSFITFEVWINPSSNASVIGNKTAVAVHYDFIEHFIELFVS